MIEVTNDKLNVIVDNIIEELEIFDDDETYQYELRIEFTFTESDSEFEEEMISDSDDSWETISDSEHSVFDRSASEDEYEKYNLEFVDLSEYY